jgi:hypothetical protein
MSEGRTKGSFGKPALTYIEECNIEREMEISITSEVTARPLSWGLLLEKRVHDLLGTSYEYLSDVTKVHPNYNYWAGSLDFFKHSENKTVVDVKCPITRKSFYQLVKDNDINLMRERHKDGDKYYWQLVSNAIINDCTHAELIVYMPYQSELEAIRELASNYDGDQNKVAWINWSADQDLPYIKNDGKFKNLNIISFEIPEIDKLNLTDRVIEASKLLINNQ